MLKLLFSLLALLCTSLIDAEPPKPRHGSQLIVVNDDGFSAFHGGRYKTTEDLRNAIATFDPSL